MAHQPNQPCKPTPPPRAWKPYPLSWWPAVSNYFGGSCVPGAGETSYSESLCRLCRGDSSGGSVCDKSPLERYYDYSGAFRCLAEGAGDVAFVKHSTVLENTDGKTLPSWGQALLSQDFKLLCRDGSWADVTEWRQCHLARVPAHAVVVRADTDGGLIFRLLNEGQRLFSHEGSSFQMFSSDAYGQKNLLFKDSTSELVPIATQTYEAWLGHEYLHAMKGLLCDPNRLPPYLRWCVLSTPEIQKCGDMAVAFSRQKLRPEIQCVSAESPQHCMEQIQTKARCRGGPRGPVVRKEDCHGHDVQPRARALAVSPWVPTPPVSVFRASDLEGPGSSWEEDPGPLLLLLQAERYPSTLEPPPRPRDCHLFRSGSFFHLYTCLTDRHCTTRCAALG
ncbi:hypothetical protein P7K49_030214 [Saguinus oedipus]|uniref:Transferrin-like domain-containing protein n=1 Tax=Saguinus oedipus TaxID=9490 RepID=A0ABQ9U2F0_SAGOE|nr:hypothetical protein P7K49_030214 [Saguinus oedipus]